MTPRDKAVCLLLFALLVRFECGLHSYSGQGTPPKFGDYEAQRHWMEIAVHTPARLWYTNTTDNDLGYWGLDYPPLSGYQSWLYGKAIEWVEPEAVALRSSRGYETPTSKTFMRWTAVFSDLVCFFPAAWAAAAVFGGGAAGRLTVLAALLLNPAQLLIDHGHFQYNGIGLGLAAGAAAAVCSGRHVLGSVLYCLSLNHKQMGLYYAPAFFAYLLAACLRQLGWGAKLAAVAKLGAAVLLTFALVWLPYLGSAEAALSVVRRVFPTKRGLYEDYVANFWCVSSLVVKWKQLLPPAHLVRLCTLLTLAAFAPGMAFQFRDRRPGSLLASMALASLAFYQFSFQVHEKSILLPLLPLSVMAGEHLALVAWTSAVAVFSMGPLLVKDGLMLASAAVLAIYGTTVHALLVGGAAGQGAAAAGGVKRGKPPLSLTLRRLVKPALAASFLGMAGLAAVAKAVAPPPRWPYLWDALVMAWSYLHFAAVFLYLHWV